MKEALGDVAAVVAVAVVAMVVLVVVVEDEVPVVAAMVVDFVEELEGHLAVDAKAVPAVHGCDACRQLAMPVDG